MSVGKRCGFSKATGCSRPTQPGLTPPGAATSAGDRASSAVTHLAHPCRRRARVPRVSEV